MSKIKVLIYEPYIFNIYGNTRYLLSIFKYIDRSAFELSLCVMYEHEFLDRIRALGGNCIVLPAGDKLQKFGGVILADRLLGRIKTTIDVFKNYVQIARVIKNDGYQVLQCHSVRSFITSAPGAIWCRIPAFWYIKGELGNVFLDTICFFLASKIIFQSELNRDKKYRFLRCLFSTKIELNRNGIDLDDVEHRVIHEDNPVLRLKDSKVLKIVCVGQVSPLKGTQLLIDALAEIKDRIPPFHVFLVGDYVLDKYKQFHQNLVGKISTHGLDEHVTLTGWRSDAIEITSLCDLLIHPSLTEGVPKAVIEGMALGKPIIATDVGGTAELLTYNNGLLIKPGSVEELKNAILQITADASVMERMGEAGRAAAFNNYSIRDNIRRLERVYRQLAHA